MFPPHCAGHDATEPGNPIASNCGDSATGPIEQRSNSCDGQEFTSRCHHPRRGFAGLSVTVCTSSAGSGLGSGSDETVSGCTEAVADAGSSALSASLGCGAAGTGVEAGSGCAEAVADTGSGTLSVWAGSAAAGAVA